MNKIILLSLAFFACALIGRSQVAEYFFSQQNLTYTGISGGTQLFSGTFDDNVSGEVAIPSFVFNDTAYTSIFISSNGYITFGTAPASNNYAPISNSGDYKGAVSAFGRDLNQAETGSPEVRYELVGNEFVIQWKDVRRKNVSGEYISFQIRLNTSNNYIKIVYGGTITPGNFSTYPQVGLRGPNNTISTNVNNRTIAAEGGKWINSTRGTTNSRTMYFNSADTTTVPSPGLTYTWKPVYNPKAFISEAVSLSEIDLHWNKNLAGHNVLLAFNTTTTFGTPVNGTTYSAGNALPGGGTILFQGNGTEFNHTTLSTNTVYYYKIWSVDEAIDYSPGATTNTRTGIALPYLQDFNGTTATGWDLDMSLTTNHGTAGSKGLTKQLTSGTTYATSPLIGNISTSTKLSFHYRIVDNFGYPLNATSIGANDKIEIQVSLDNGATFTTFYTIDQSNHIASVEFANKVLSLEAYSSDFIKIRFFCTWGEGNYYVDIDNVLIEEGNNMSYSGSTAEQPNTSNAAINSTDNEVIMVKMITQKTANPLSVTSISFNTTGCTNASTDLAAAKVYYTSTPVFSTGTQFGATLNNPSGSFSVTGSQSLAQGNNYFWLAYDLRATATAGNVIDGQCTQFITSESGTAKVPNTTSPTGTRKIGSVLSGTKSIPGDYASIAEAVTALNGSVIGEGGVTVNVAANHTEAVVAPILLTATGTADKPIVFQKSGEGNNPLITCSVAGSINTTTLGYNGDAIILIEGGDYITFSQIDLTSTNSGIEYGYYLRKASVTDGPKNVTIQDSHITMEKGTSKYVVGICVSNNSSGSNNINVTTTAGSSEYISLTGNTISNTFTGMYLKGSGTFFDQFFTIGLPDQGNTIQNFAGNVASAQSYGIYINCNHGSKVSYNSINNTAGGGTAFVFNASGIHYADYADADFTAENNTMALTSISSMLYGIYNTSLGDLKINQNTISLSNTTSTSSVYGFIFNDPSSTASVENIEINNNVFASNGINTTGNTYLIYNNSARLNPEITIISGNSTSGTINRTGTSGAFYLYYNSSAETGTENISGNQFSNITLSGTSLFQGIYSSTSANHSQNVYNNTISNITGGTGSITGINLLVANSRSVYGNHLSGITGGGTVTAIISGTGSNPGHIYKNLVDDLTSTSTASTAGLVTGISVTSGSSVYLYNNFISDLKAPNASNSDAIRGISVTSTAVNSTMGIYYNTIYLNAASVGTNFGSSGVYHTASSTATTANLDLRNNIVVNESVANGSGLTTAFRRSAATLSNYANTLNNNIFYAGEPGTKNLILYNLSPYQTIEAYKTLVGPNRDSLSFSEMPPFVNDTLVPYNLRLQDGANSFCESGAQPVALPIVVADDFDGAARGTSPDVGADEFSGVSAYVAAPASLTASSLNSQQIRLNFGLNAQGNGIVIVYNTTGTFTKPDHAPVVGEALGGGTVLYFGTTSPVTHSALTPNTPVYYKVFSYNGANYSDGLTANATPTVTPPTNFTATCGGQNQIDLGWTKNAYDHDVLIASHNAYMSGNPLNGTEYPVGSAIPSGGTVIYKGPASGFNHDELTAWSQKYYKAWSVDIFDYYSSSVTANAVTDANPVTQFPYLQNMDGTWSHDPSAPQDWLVVDGNGTSSLTWVQSNLNFLSSPYGARGYGNGTCNDYLISPPLQLPDTDLQISWWDKVSLATRNNSYRVLLSTTNNLTSSFTIVLGDFDCTNTSWVQHFIDLTAYKGQTVYIAFFQYYSQSQYQNFGIDDVIVDCYVPGSAGLVSPINNMLTFPNPLLKWSVPISSSPITGYKVYLGMDPNPATLVYNGTELSFLPDELAHNTKYYWKVVPYNASGDATNVPVWSFSTVTSTQLAESFEAEYFPPVGWENSGWIKTENPFHGRFSARRYTSPVENLRLITPLLSITTGDKLAFFEGTSSSAFQRIQIMYSTDKYTWTDIGEEFTVTTGTWGYHEIDLSVLAGNNYYLAFSAYYVTGGNAAYVYIDHITGPGIVPVLPKPAVNPDPNDLGDYLSLNFSLGWNPDNTGGIPTGYKLYFDADPNPTTLIYNGANSFYPISSLENNTTYYWKVVPYNTVGDAINCVVWSFTTGPLGLFQVGRGANENEGLPLYPDFNYNYTQTIYLQPEIKMANQRISKIFYHWNGGETGNNYKDWVIYLGHTSKTEFASTSDWVSIDDMTKVFDGEVILPATDGWVEIVLDTTFEYNNTHNLVVAVDENTIGYGNNPAFFYCTGESTARGIQYFKDEINPDPANPPTADYLVNGIANIRFQFEEIPTSPVFFVNPVSLDYGNALIGFGSEQQVFSIKNSGIGTLDIQSINLAGTNSNQFHLTDANSYPVSLGANEAIIVEVSFNPTSEGTKNASLEIMDNLSGTPHQVPLSGVGIDPLVSVFPFTETFEEDSPTRNKWSQIKENGEGLWTFNEGAGGGTITTAHTGVLNARFTSTQDLNQTKLVSPVLNISGMTNPKLEFWYGQDSWISDQNELKVYYRTAPAQPWVEIFYDYADRDVWTQKILSLPEKSATYQLAFEGWDYYGNANVLDDVRVYAGDAPVVPENMTVSDITLGNTESGCFNALNTLTVAGNGSSVVFESGSVTDLIAGQSILFLPGFHAQNGSQVNAWITTNNTFCGGIAGGLLRLPEEKSIEEQELVQNKLGNKPGKEVKVYPNPNDGRFTVELIGFDGAEVTVYNATGKKLLLHAGVQQTHLLMSLPNLKKGIYFAKVNDNKKQIIRKFIVD